jgi:hydroxymethylpyrimidine pyrophosphatase-like HAD family hydrolase
MIIAVDVDGTLYDGIGVHQAATDALRSARNDGHTIVIVTGRRWEQLGHVVPTILGLADCAVCEEGGVLIDLQSSTDVRLASVTLLAEPTEPHLVAALRAAGVTDLDVGRVVVGAPTGTLATVTRVRDQVGSNRLIITNKGSIALTPRGCDKGSGLRAALRALTLEHLPVLAIGDAENDLAMFAVAAIAVGVANADDAVRASGVPLTQAVSGLGVAEALGRFLPQPEAFHCVF